MKRPVIISLCALLMAAVMFFAVIPANADGGASAFYMYVQTGNTGRLHLRALPTVNAQSLGLFYNGTPVLVENISGGWALVQVNGQRGYMSMNCLSAIPPVNPTGTPVPTEYTTLYIQTGNSGKLHLREYASQNARSLGLYPNGTAVTVTTRSGQWAYVNVGGVYGYMMLKFLSAAGPVTPTVQPTLNPSIATLMYVRTGNAGKLHLREYASQNARSLGLFPNGTLLYAVNLGNGWSQVSVNGLSGYMMTQFLAVSSSNITPAPVTPVPVPTEFTLMYIATGNSGKLNLRENMSTDAASLGQYPNGTQVSVIANYGTWAYVYVDGKMGYMMTRYLAAYQTGIITPTPMPGTTPAPLSSATVQQPNNSFVYLRSSRSSNGTANVICQVPSGSVVTVVEWGQWWSKILYNGMEGYIVTHYLK
ncbi:MAG: SH3 domain-containing protein [Clostridia bacterium]|nr:SH3 domain-containing protein [Clostridia bacterium]